MMKCGCVSLIVVSSSISSEASWLNMLPKPEELSWLSASPAECRAVLPPSGPSIRSAPSTGGAYRLCLAGNTGAPSRAAALLASEPSEPAASAALAQLSPASAADLTRSAHRSPSPRSAMSCLSLAFSSDKAASWASILVCKVCSLALLVCGWLMLSEEDTSQANSCDMNVHQSDQNRRLL